MNLKEEERSRICREVSIKVGADGKESACNAGDPGSIPKLGSIPWTEESGRLQPMESQRGGRDWSDWACSIHTPGTKLIEEGVDKNHGFSKCVEFVSFLFFIHLSFLFLWCKYVHVWGKDALVGWVKSSSTRTQEKRNMEEHETAGLGPQRWPRTQEIMFTKKALETQSINDASGPWWHKKKQELGAFVSFASECLSGAWGSRPPAGKDRVEEKKGNSRPGCWADPFYCFTIKSESTL